MVAEKLKEIFDDWAPDGVSYRYTTFAQANVAFDHIDGPAIIVEAPTLGSLVPFDRQFSDYPKLRIWALEPMRDWDQDRDISDAQIQDMKVLVCRFLVKIAQSRKFYPLQDRAELPYLVNLNGFNRGECGIGVTIDLKERRASINLCNDDDL